MATADQEQAKPTKQDKAFRDALVRTLSDEALSNLVIPELDQIRKKRFWRGGDPLKDMTRGGFYEIIAKILKGSGVNPVIGDTDAIVAQKKAAHKAVFECLDSAMFAEHDKALRDAIIKSFPNANNAKIEEFDLIRKKGWFGRDPLEGMTHERFEKIIDSIYERTQPQESDSEERLNQKEAAREALNKCRESAEQFAQKYPHPFLETLRKASSPHGHPLMPDDGKIQKDIMKIIATLDAVDNKIIASSSESAWHDYIDDPTLTRGQFYAHIAEMVAGLSVNTTHSDPAVAQAYSQARDDLIDILLNIEDSFFCAPLLKGAAAIAAAQREEQKENYQEAKKIYIWATERMIEVQKTGNDEIDRVITELTDIATQGPAKMDVLIALAKQEEDRQAAQTLPQAKAAMEEAAELFKGFKYKEAQNKYEAALTLLQAIPDANTEAKTLKDAANAGKLGVEKILQGKIDVPERIEKGKKSANDDHNYYNAYNFYKDALDLLKTLPSNDPNVKTWTEEATKGWDTMRDLWGTECAIGTSLSKIQTLFNQDINNPQIYEAIIDNSEQALAALTKIPEEDPRVKGWADDFNEGLALGLINRGTNRLQKEFKYAEALACFDRAIEALQNISEREDWKTTAQERKQTAENILAAQQTAAQAMVAAVGLVEQNKYTEALEKYGEVLEALNTIPPNDPEAIQWKAAAEAGKAKMKDILEIKVTLAEAMAEAAGLVEQNKYDKAQEKYEEILNALDQNILPETDPEAIQWKTTAKAGKAEMRRHLDSNAAPVAAPPPPKVEEEAETAEDSVKQDFNGSAHGETTIDPEHVTPLVQLLEKVNLINTKTSQAEITQIMLALRQVTEAQIRAGLALYKVTKIPITDTLAFLVDTCAHIKVEESVPATAEIEQNSPEPG